MEEYKKRYLRGKLFQHLDGIAITSTIATFLENDITEFIINKKEFTLNDILEKFKCNPGYMNVSLRLLSSQGWLKRSIVESTNNIEFKLTDKGKTGFSYSNQYSTFNNFLTKLINIDKFLFTKNTKDIEEEIDQLLIQIDQLYLMDITLKSIESDVVRHLEGIIAGPILVSLGMSDFFIEHIKNNSEINEHDLKKTLPSIKSIIKIFEKLGWIESINNKFFFSDEGLFFIKRAAAYGVTVSYLPTFIELNNLLFGNPNILWEKGNDEPEKHVDRRMNVWGSGGAHKLYFKKIDEIIINIFNKPLDEQPLGIADMGCGNGTLLKHLFEVIKNKTLRGRNLDILPLKLIGADFNKAARIASSITLQEANIDHSILSGDISNPKEFSNNLKKICNLDLNKMLNIRSFLDHNRIYSEPQKNFKNIKSNSTGAFAYRGRLITNQEIKQNLIEHFYSWKSYINKHGLLILELHTIPPDIAAQNISNTLATAYDSTHGFSDQYIIELDSMIDAARNAGLVPNYKYQACFPDSKMTTISINLFTTT